MKKVALSLLVITLLAGCAGSQQGLGLYQLETPTYMRDNRNLSMDFVQIQRAVFAQQNRCDSLLDFKVDDKHPGYARVTYPFSEGAQPGEWDKFLVLGLTRVQFGESKVLGITLRDGTEALTRAQLFSYYAPTKEQIRAVYRALQHPELCPGETPPEQTDEAQEKGAND